MGEKEINCETGFIAEADWINWYMSALQKQYVHRGEIIYSKMPKIHENHFNKLLYVDLFILNVIMFARFVIFFPVQWC